MTLNVTAIAVILITVASFTLLGLLQASRQATNLEDYLVNRNRVGTRAALATIVASAMGAWILFSPPRGGGHQRHSWYCRVLHWSGHPSGTVCRAGHPHAVSDAQGPLAK